MQGRRKQIQSGPAIFQLFSTITPTATHRRDVAARGVWGHAPHEIFKNPLILVAFGPF